MLSMLALCSDVDASEIKYWFMTEDDQINSIVTIFAFSVICLIPFIIAMMVAVLGKRLERPELNQRIGFLYEGYQIGNRHSRVFFVWDFWKRGLLAASLLFFDSHPVF